MTPVAAALLVAPLCALSAQAASLAGVVRGGADKHPMSCMQVVLQDSAGHDLAWTHTDDRALFTIAVPTAGVYRLRFDGWSSAYAPFDTVHNGEYHERAYELGDEPDGMPDPRPYWPGNHARPMEGMPSPRYPESERLANRQGEVLVEFVVDSTGRVDLPSVRTIKASEIDFRDAVLAVIPQLRFHPATEHGTAVCERVWQPFAFSLTPDP